MRKTELRNQVLIFTECISLFKKPNYKYEYK